MKLDLLKIKLLSSDIMSGDRRALAQCITLIESDNTNHKKFARYLLKKIMPKTGKSFRIGVSGPPGVGKSTFIETFGLHLVSLKNTLAVLTVDPSSRNSGGSILGDKTRMEQLSSNSDAFIRPSPSKNKLGGVSRHTREVLLLCEAAGFENIIVETVGVGQSETSVESMVDMFILLIAPGGGDQLQGIKRGIVELADLIIVNKADGDLYNSAKLMESDYKAAIRLISSNRESWKPKVVTCSALEGSGIKDISKIVNNYKNQLKTNNKLDILRKRQANEWLWEEIKEGLLDSIVKNAEVLGLVKTFEEKIKQGTELPGMAAEQILAKFFKDRE